MDRLYAATLSLYVLVLVLSLFRLRLLPLIIAAALAVNAWALALITIRSGHLPVFNLFESFLLVSFILGLLGISTRDHGKGESRAGGWLWLETVVLLGILLFFPKSPSVFRYDHNDLYIVLFHLLRNVALAVVLFSSSYFIQARFEGPKTAPGARHFHQGRNFLLLGAIFFLISELVGIIWCLNGWGDVWRWNTAFFQSTLIVLYFMLAFHVPGKNRRSDNARSLVGGLGGFFMLTLTVVRGLA